MGVRGWTQGQPPSRHSNENESVPHTHLEHRDGLVEHRLVVPASAGKSCDAPEEGSFRNAIAMLLEKVLPEGAQAEGAFLAPDAVVRLGHVVPVDQTLCPNKNKWIVACRKGWARCTFEVRPPRSGDCKMALSVFKNRGSACKQTDTQQCDSSSELPRGAHGSGEEHERHDEQRRVEDVLVLVALRVELLVLVVPLRHDLLVERVPCRVPLVAPGARERSLLCESDA